MLFQRPKARGWSYTRLLTLFHRWTRIRPSADTWPPKWTWPNCRWRWSNGHWFEARRKSPVPCVWDVWNPWARIRRPDVKNAGGPCAVILNARTTNGIRPNASGPSIKKSKRWEIRNKYRYTHEHVNVILTCTWFSDESIISWHGRRNALK